MQGNERPPFTITQWRHHRWQGVWSVPVIPEQVGCADDIMILITLQRSRFSAAPGARTVFMIGGNCDAFITPGIAAIPLSNNARNQRFVFAPT